jgi:hypothetical protein
MTISKEERQKRIDRIEAENKALKKLNDLSDLRKRVERDGSLLDDVEDTGEPTDTFKKVAVPPV